jgi:hypothetical protein
MSTLDVGAMIASYMFAATHSTPNLNSKKMNTQTLTPVCNDAITNVYYVSIHFIDKVKYERMIFNFFGEYIMSDPAPPTRTIASPIAKTKEDIGYETEGITCITHFIKYEGDDREFNHADLELGPQRFSDSEELFQAVAGRYSIQFFRGLEYLYPDGAFYFSKARTDQGEFTLVILVKVGGEAVYYGDLTNMYP